MLLEQPLRESIAKRKSRIVLPHLQHWRLLATLSWMQTAKVTHHLRWWHGLRARSQRACVRAASLNSQAQIQWGGFRLQRWRAEVKTIRVIAARDVASTQQLWRPKKELGWHQWYSMFEIQQQVSRINQVLLSRAAQLWQWTVTRDALKQWVLEVHWITAAQRAADMAEQHCVQRSLRLAQVGSLTWHVPSTRPCAFIALQ